MRTSASATDFGSGFGFGSRRPARELPYQKEQAEIPGPGTYDSNGAFRSPLHRSESRDSFAVRFAARSDFIGSRGEFDPRTATPKTRERRSVLRTGHSATPDLLLTSPRFSPSSHLSPMHSPRHLTCAPRQTPTRIGSYRRRRSTRELRTLPMWFSACPAPEVARVEPSQPLRSIEPSLLRRLEASGAARSAR